MQKFDLQIFDEFVQIFNLERMQVEQKLTLGFGRDKIIQDGIANAFEIIFSNISKDPRLNFLMEICQKHIKGMKGEETDYAKIVQDKLQQEQQRQSLNKEGLNPIIHPQENLPNQAMNNSNTIEFINQMKIAVQNQSLEQGNLINNNLTTQYLAKEKLNAKNESINSSLLVIQQQIQQIKDNMSKKGAVQSQPNQIQPKRQFTLLQARNKVIQLDIRPAIAPRNVPAPQQQQVFQQQKYQQVQNQNNIGPIAEKKIRSIAQTKMHKGFGSSFQSICRLNNGVVAVGTEHSQLLLFSENFQLIKTVDLTNTMRSCVSINSHLYCGTIDGIVSIYNMDTLEQVNMGQFQTSIIKLAQVEQDFLFIGEIQGHIDVIQVAFGNVDIVEGSDLRQVISTQHFLKSEIQNLVKTQYQDEYCICTRTQGLAFIKLTKDESYNMILSQNIEEKYYPGQFISSVAPARGNLLLVFIDKKQHVEVINRDTCQVVDSIKNVSIGGTWNCSQLIMGFDETRFPFILYRDTEKLGAINAKTFETKDIALQGHSLYRINSSFHQFKDGGKLKILLMGFQNDGSGNNTGDRAIYEYALQE